MVIAKVLYWLCGVLVMALFVCVNYAKRQKANAKRYKVKLDENNRMIAGLIANKLMAKYQRPVCVLTKVIND